MVCPGKLGSVVEREADIRIWGATSDLRSSHITCTMNNDLENTDGGIQGDTRENLLKIEGENVWVIHHRSQGAMDHVSDECGKSGNLLR